MRTPCGDDEEFVFAGSEATSRKGLWLIAGACCGFAFAVFGFFASIFLRRSAGQMSVHALVTFPAILSLAALSAGWVMRKTPRRVVVGAGGVTVESKHGIRDIGWGEVGAVVIGNAGTSQRKRLNLTDVRGRSLLSIDESFSGFDRLAAAFSRHIDAKGDDTAMRVLRRKARLTGSMCVVMGLLMGAGSIFMVSHVRNEQRAKRLLHEKGELGEGTIVRLFVAPNGFTKRLEYRVANSDVRNVEVQPDVWNRLQGAKTVQVIYVADEPNISRLLAGEVVENDFTETPVGGYGMAALCALVATFMTVAGAFVFLGWDLGQDSRTKRWHLKRYGRVVWRSGSKDNAKEVLASDEWDEVDEDE
jgi:hypothetical protein